MRLQRLRSWLIQLLLLTVLTGTGSGEDHFLKKSIPYSGEKKVSVTVSFKKTRLKIRSHHDNDVMRGQFYWKSPDYEPIIEYSTIGRRGKLEIIQKDVGDLGEFDDSFKDLKNKETEDSVDVTGKDWDLSFSESVPYEFQINAGLGDCQLDFSNLMTEELSINSGFSDVTLSCKVPNEARMNKLEINNGLGKFVGEYLGNFGFKKMELNCGLGSASVDLRGELRDNAVINISVGLATLILTLPSDVGVKMKVDKSFLSSFSCSDFVNKDGRYFSRNYDEVDTHITIDLSIGLGIAAVQWSN